MTDWVPLDANTLALPKHRTIRGVDITLVTSPYDIPEAVRGDYNKELRRFVIEFRYMSDEPLERYKCGKDIILRIGRNSGRLYSIEIDIHDLSTQEINLRMNVAKAATNAINRLAHEAEKPQRQANYEVAKDAIEEKQNEIFESLATP
jgi:hypothetical protein